MPIKKYTDFGKDSEETKVTPEIEIIKEIEPMKEEPMKEEKLLTPVDKTNNLDIEILEEKIIKFNKGVLKDILETLKSKYSDTDYFIRKKDNELHIVKYNESLKLNINEFVNNLLKFYSTKMDSKRITEGIKVKGNSKFSIIENMKTENSERFINDLTHLLAKKNKEE